MTTILITYTEEVSEFDRWLYNSKTHEEEAIFKTMPVKKSVRWTTVEDNDPAKVEFETNRAKAYVAKEMNDREYSHTIKVIAQ